MSFAPLPYALDVVGTAEVVAVVVFIKPLPTACCFGSLAAFGLAAISLMPDIAVVRKKEVLTVPALALSNLFSHGSALRDRSWGQHQGLWNKTVKKEAKKEKRRRKNNLCADVSEEEGISSGIFKSAVLMHFQVAADKYNDP
jgi:hypothetical protein